MFLLIYIELAESAIYYYKSLINQVINSIYYIVKITIIPLMNCVYKVGLCIFHYKELFLECEIMHAVKYLEDGLFKIIEQWTSFLSENISQIVIMSFSEVDAMWKGELVCLIVG